jgi:hypothetical protein
MYFSIVALPLLAAVANAWEFIVYDNACGE